MAKILVSEADPDVRRLLAVLVRRLGHDAVVLDAGAEAPPRGDLLLLEPLSRRCLEQARAVRSDAPDVPVICMGSLTDEGGFLLGGPVGFLPKPFTLEQMRERIVQTLAGSRAA
jgi:DNA-binding response OmpR family regulator